MKTHRVALGSLFSLYVSLGAIGSGCSAQDNTSPYPPSGNGSGGSKGGSGGASSSGGSASVGSSGGSVGSGGTVGSSGGTGGAGGAVGTGGVAASGGAASACTPVAGTAADAVITNLEMGMNTINPPRTGYWYSFGDAGSQVLPAPDPSGVTPFPPTEGGANSTLWTAKFSGTGGKSVGIGFDLHNAGGKSCPYNASAYTGVTFYYKSSHELRVGVATVTTTPAPAGTCVGECYNHHGKKLPAAAAWTQATVTFATMTQDFGTVGAFDPTNTLQIQFQVGGVYNETTMVVDPIVGAYDVSVDEVSFI